MALVLSRNALCLSEISGHFTNRKNYHFFITLVKGNKKTSLPIVDSIR